MHKYPMLRKSKTSSWTNSLLSLRITSQSMRMLRELQQWRTVKLQRQKTNLHSSILQPTTKQLKAPSQRPIGRLVWKKKRNFSPLSSKTSTKSNQTWVNSWKTHGPNVSTKSRLRWAEWRKTRVKIWQSIKATMLRKRLLRRSTSKKWSNSSSKSMTNKGRKRKRRTPSRRQCYSKSLDWKPWRSSYPKWKSKEMRLRMPKSSARRDSANSSLMSIRTCWRTKSRSKTRTKLSISSKMISKRRTSLSLPKSQSWDLCRKRPKKIKKSAVRKKNKSMRARASTLTRSRTGSIRAPTRCWSSRSSTSTSKSRSFRERTSKKTCLRRVIDWQSLWSKKSALRWKWRSSSKLRRTERKSTMKEP